MDDNLRRLLHQNLVDGIAMHLPALTRWDTWIPRVPGKVLAVIGMRRTGKTSLLWQELAGRLAASGMERSGLPWISLEDERLIGAGGPALSAPCSNTTWSAICWRVASPRCRALMPAAAGHCCSAMWTARCCAT
ncbi:hypothetical protein [Synechococcus sp. CB0205]|uniref:hypothetical protein n=1 Tax=Synechococcus sp. CB0205 TaxID=232363 RepID=UPI0002002D76|nr:hypothetical protein [Synechococcus sp. CB0205]